MSHQPAVDASSLQWLFGTMQENLPGAFVDQLIMKLVTIPADRWVEACQVWTAASQARKFTPEQADLIVRLSLETMKVKFGG